jgi:hypothetical protein
MNPSGFYVDPIFPQELQLSHLNLKKERKYKKRPSEKMAFFVIATGFKPVTG